MFFAPMGNVSYEQDESRKGDKHDQDCCSENVEKSRDHIKGLCGKMFFFAKRKDPHGEDRERRTELPLHAFVATIRLLIGWANDLLRRLPYRRVGGRVRPFASLWHSSCAECRTALSCLGEVASGQGECERRMPILDSFVNGRSFR